MVTCSQLRQRLLKEDTQVDQTIRRTAVRSTPGKASAARCPAQLPVETARDL